MDAGIKRALAENFDIPPGSLPGIYLGFPLISVRLIAADCAVLKEKIPGRITGWSNKALSYGGRAQLIQSVQINIEVYWCSIFVLP